VQVIAFVFTTTAQKVAGGLACGLLLSLLFKGTLSRFAEGSSYSPLAFGGVILRWL
jgi:hypothetical protein